MEESGAPLPSVSARRGFLSEEVHKLLSNKRRGGEGGGERGGRGDWQVLSSRQRKRAAEAVWLFKNVRVQQLTDVKSKESQQK